MTASALLIVALAAVQAAPLQGQRPCWIDSVQEQIGQRGDEWLLQKSFGDVRVCAVASRVPDTDDVLPGDWLGRAPMVLLETRIGRDVHRMSFAQGGATFAINDSARAIDSTAKEWRNAVLDLVDATWLLSRLPARDDRTASGGQAMVASVSGDVAAMREELAALKTAQRSLAGEIANLRAESSRIMADIRSERSSISALQSSRSSANQAERARLNREIQRVYEDIRRLEGSLSRVELDARSRESRMATMGRRIQQLNRQINPVLDSAQRAERGELDVVQLTRQLESHTEAALLRLRSALRNR